MTDGVANPTLLKNIAPGGIGSAASLPEADDPLRPLQRPTTAPAAASSGARTGRRSGTTMVMNLNPSGSGASGGIERMPDGAYMFGGNNG